MTNLCLHLNCYSDRGSILCKAISRLPRMLQSVKFNNNYHKTLYFPNIGKTDCSSSLWRWSEYSLYTCMCNDWSNVDTSPWQLHQCRHVSKMAVSNVDRCVPIMTQSRQACHPYVNVHVSKMTVSNVDKYAVPKWWIYLHTTYALQTFPTTKIIHWKDISMLFEDNQMFFTTMTPSICRAEDVTYMLRADLPLPVS